MKVIECEKTRPYERNSLNFIDDNDIVLGYDAFQCCCENFGWFIADEIKENVPNEVEVEPDCFDSFSFDPDFCQEVSETGNYDEVYIAAFKITDGSKELYLHLFNCHNGYYGHGFSFINDGEVVRKGTL